MFNCGWISEVIFEIIISKHSFDLKISLIKISPRGLDEIIKASKA